MIEFLKQGIPFFVYLAIIIAIGCFLGWLGRDRK